MPSVSPWKSDFPIFSQHAHPQLSYLDSAATCLTPKVVADAIYQYQCYSHANSHKGLYQLSANATALVEQARQRVAGFIGVGDSEQIIFTPGTTQAINLVANSFVKARLSSKHNIVITCAEHHANLLPWQRLCEQTGAELRTVSLLADGLLDLQALALVLDENTCLLALTHVSNVLGRVNPIKEICQLARGKLIPVLVDGAQAVGHGPVDVEDLGCDFYAFSAHKLYGPVGCGVLYAKAEHLTVMQPDVLGGGSRYFGEAGPHGPAIAARNDGNRLVRRLVAEDAHVHAG